MSPEQLSECRDLYIDGNKIHRSTYQNEKNSQLMAKSMLKQSGFDWDAREQLEAKWCIVWSTSWKGTQNTRIRRVLYQW
jgi:hypothetical protein